MATIKLRQRISGNTRTYKLLPSKSISKIINEDIDSLEIISKDYVNEEIKTLVNYHNYEFEFDY